MKKLTYLFGFAVFVVACSPKTTEAITEDVSETEVNEEMPKAAIGEGKVVYLKDCTKCHGAKKIEDFTPEQWANILPRMVKKAQLNEKDAYNVEAYITWEIEND